MARRHLFENGRGAKAECPGPPSHIWATVRDKTF